MGPPRNRITTMSIRNIQQINRQRFSLPTRVTISLNQNVIRHLTSPPINHSPIPTLGVHRRFGVTRQSRNLRINSTNVNRRTTSARAHDAKSTYDSTVYTKLGSRTYAQIIPTSRQQPTQQQPTTVPRIAAAGPTTNSPTKAANTSNANSTKARKTN